MKIEISKEELARIVECLEHRARYLRTQRRWDRDLELLLARLEPHVRNIEKSC